MKYLEQIEAYWEQRMSRAEREAFERDLGKNPQLKEEMKAYEASLRLLELSSTGQLGSKQVAKRANGRWLSIAAATLLILGLSLFAYANFRYAPGRMAARSYSPPLLSGLQRSTETGSRESAAFQYFAEENYQAVIKLLSPKDSLDSSLSYLLAHAYYLSGDWREAQTQFMNVLQSKEFQHGARWYLALAQLKAGEIESAHRHLLLIRQDQESPNQERANELLKKLESGWRHLVVSS